VNAVVDIVVPIFGIGLLGYFAGRQGWFSDHASEGLARFVFDWAVPIMLVRVFATTALPEHFPWKLLVAFYVPAYCLYALGIYVARKFFAQPRPEQVITGFSCAFGNSVLLGLPLTLFTFDEAGTIPFFILLSVHGLSYFTVTTVLLESTRSSSRSPGKLVAETGKGMIRNPIILGLATGLVLNQLHVSLPGPLDKIASYMQLAVMPCALFSLGAALHSYGIAGQLRQSAFIVCVKNILFPLVVWLTAKYLLELPALWAMVATLLAATPSGVNTYLFAQRYQAAPGLASTTVFLSHLVSLVSLTVLIYFFRLSGW